VVVMQPSPGRIRRIVDVDLPHPRNRSDPEFIRLRDDVLGDFLDTAPVPRAEPPARGGIAAGSVTLPQLQLAW